MPPTRARLPSQGPCSWTISAPVHLLAQIRSDEETLGEIFNGTPYYTDKEPAEDPDFDWQPRKEQVFSDKQLMQLSIWKKEWDDEKKEYEPVDLSYSPYSKEQTRKYKKLGWLDENVRRAVAG
jgi:hypothetical protein